MDDDHAQGLGVIVALMAIGAVIIYVFVRMILTSQGPKDPQRGQRPVFHRRGSKEDVVEKLETEEKRFLFFRNNRERVRYLFPETGDESLFREGACFPYGRTALRCHEKGQ